MLMDGTKCFALLDTFDEFTIGGRPPNGVLGVRWLGQSAVT